MCAGKDMQQKPRARKSQNEGERKGGKAAENDGKNRRVRSE